MNVPSFWQARAVLGTMLAAITVFKYSQVEKEQHQL
jgi:hypothetical protein